MSFGINLRFFASPYFDHSAFMHHVLHVHVGLPDVSDSFCQYATQH